MLFTHRFYNPDSKRWLTTDPLGCENGLNLYAYVRNNPFYYKDPDGQIAFVIPVLIGVFGTGGIVLGGPTIGAIAGTAAGLALGWAVCKADKWYDNSLEDSLEMRKDAEEAQKEKKGRKKGKDNVIKGGPPREPQTGDYLPDPAAEGSPHTTLGTQQGRHEIYTQGATFDEKGEFKGRTDVTDHGRIDHPNPHYHPATSPNGTKPGPHPIPVI